MKIEILGHWLIIERKYPKPPLGDNRQTAEWVVTNQPKKRLEVKFDDSDGNFNISALKLIKPNEK